MPKARKKGEKDPRKPKRVKSAYIYYFTERRHQVGKDNPSLSFNECGKLMAKLWKEMGDEEKKVFSRRLPGCGVVTKFCCFSFH
jgi:HMG (high mobility group) box protein